MSRPPTLLLVDPHLETRNQVGEAVNRSGMVLRSVADPAQVLRGAQALRPELIIVHSEVRGQVLGQVLDVLAKDATWAHAPIVVIAQDTSEARFIHQLRTGVVAILQKPFYAAHHLAELRVLLGELPRRSGVVSGHGDSKELAQLVEHLRRTQRSGALSLNARTPEEGRALFARGVLKEAEHLGSTGVEALLAMVAAPRAAWSFAEVGQQQSELVIDLQSAAGDSPLAAPEEEGPFEVEVGDTATGEIEIPIEVKRSLRPRPKVAEGPTPILLVDDDEALCRMFSVLFRKHGFTVTTASDGFAGYEAALKGGFDVVVADLNMPRMDGWGMLRLLRDDHRTRELPVAFLSCHDDYRNALKALDAGAQAYFSKATRMDALATQVRGLMQPRVDTSRALKEDDAASVSTGRVGAQWVVREIARQKLSGLLDAKDGWAQYRLTFVEGRAVHALAQAGRHAAEGVKAFTAFIASRGADGSFVRGTFPVGENLSLEVPALLEGAARMLNDNEARLREGLLVDARQIQVNEDLYALYAQVGPRQWLETARLVCEEKLPPREVIARVDASPVEVEETLKDLIRRGVVTLTA